MKILVFVFMTSMILIALAFELYRLKNEDWIIKGIIVGANILILVMPVIYLLFSK